MMASTVPTTFKHDSSNPELEDPNQFPAIGYLCVENVTILVLVVCTKTYILYVYVVANHELGI